MNKIKEIEKLREAVIQRHFPHYYTSPGYVNGHNCVYIGSLEERLAQEKAIDDKVIYYLKLEIGADDLQRFKNFKI